MSCTPLAAQSPILTTCRVTGDFIKIIVGQANSETLNVHETVIKQSSGFFQAALNQQWKEGQARKIELPEDDPDVVATYLEWLYSTKINHPHEAIKTPNTEQSRDAHLVYAELYCFGEKCQDDAFCNAVMLAWVDMLDSQTADGVRIWTAPGAGAVRIIYQGTPKHSPARRMLSYIYSTFGRERWITNSKNNTERGEILLDVPEFLQELVFREKKGYSWSRSGHKVSEMQAQWLK